MVRLVDILDLSPSAREAAVSGSGDPDAAVSGLVDEARSLALADLDRGLSAARALVDLADAVCGSSMRAAARSAAC